MCNILVLFLQVDWFSYGRLLYHLITGVSPSYQNDTQLEEVDQDAEKACFRFVRFTMLTSFPSLIALMRTCLRNNPQERPGDRRVLALLKDPGILALRHVIQLNPFACSCPVIATNDACAHEIEVG